MVMPHSIRDCFVHASQFRGQRLYLAETMALVLPLSLFSTLAAVTAAVWASPTPQHLIKVWWIAALPLLLIVAPFLPLLLVKPAYGRGREHWMFSQDCSAARSLVADAIYNRLYATTATWHWILLPGGTQVLPVAGVKPLEGPSRAYVLLRTRADGTCTVTFVGFPVFRTWLPHLRRLVDKAAPLLVGKQAVMDARWIHVKDAIDWCEGVKDRRSRGSEI